MFLACTSLVFARPHARTMALGLVLALLGSAAGLATPLVTKWVLDSLGEAGRCSARPACCWR